jgi:hypothetical protein
MKHGKEAENAIARETILYVPRSFGPTSGGISSFTRPVRMARTQLKYSAVPSSKMFNQ